MPRLLGSAARWRRHVEAEHRSQAPAAGQSHDDMVKSYETLVGSDAGVDVNTGMVAAGRLQSLIDSRDYSRDLLLMKVQLDQVCDAVKSTVPQEIWSEIIEKLDEAKQHQEALNVGRNSFDDADDEPFDPTEFIDEDDEF